MDESLDESETFKDLALTKTTKKGQRYKRRPVVDQQIRSVSHLSHDELIKRACQREKDNPAFLAEEALVYLIQQSHQKGNGLLRDKLMAELIGRCSAVIFSHVPGLGISRDDAVNEVIAELFRRLIAPNNIRAAYLQVNFWDALEKIAIDIRRKYPAKFVQVSGESVRLPSDGEPESRNKTRPPAEIEAGIEIEETELRQLSVEQLDTIREALDTIPEPARTAYILYHYYDFPIYSIKPDVPTISQYYNVSEKTVRNWLKEAENCLENWRGTEI